MQVAVIGSGADWAGQAEEVGRLLAGRGCVVVCGGLGDGIARAGSPAEAVELALGLVEAR